MKSRSIQIDGVFNFRDIGGYSTMDGRQVRWRSVFRSGELHRLTRRGVEIVEKELGIQSVIDLRWPDDHVRAGTTGLLAGTGINRYEMPFGDAQRLADIPPLPVGLAYLPLANRAADDVVRVLRTLIADGTLPAVIHCSAGKDRTGIIVALLLALLGVDDDTIIEDYSLTAHVMPRWIAFLIERGELPPEPSDADPHPGDEIAPDAIQAMLDTLRANHGSVASYLRQHGLMEDEIAQLRSILLE